MAGLYRGYSSFQYQTTRQFGISDLDLVKSDLLNQIFTKRGERVMMPTFGTRIPEMTFEPLDQATIDIIVDDITAVINFDPRVQLLNLQVQPSYDTNTLTVAALVYYVELNLTGTIDLNITFEQG